MTNSFSKNVLINQAELDRFQQRQLRENSPEFQAIVRLLNNMRDKANKHLTAEEQLNSISPLKIPFDKLKKETGLLSGAISTQGALDALSVTRPLLPKVLADKGIGPEIKPEKEKQEEQYKYVLKDKD